MNAERWQQIEKIYNSALEMDPADRSRYVREACAEDNDLQVEVERLLALQSKANGFMESPAIRRPSRYWYKPRPLSRLATSRANPCHIIALWRRLARAAWVWSIAPVTNI
jgi:hypothetical protein